MNNFKTLNETGIVSSPEGILEAIIQRFRITDPYQSKFFPVASLKGILALHTGSDEELKTAIHDALSTVMEAYFTDGFDLTIGLVEKSNGETDLTIAADVVTDDGSSSLAWAMQIIEDGTDLPRSISNGDIRYELR